MAKRIATFVLTLTITGCGGSFTQSGQLDGEPGSQQVGVSEEMARAIELDQRNEQQRLAAQSGSTITLTNSECTSVGVGAVLQSQFAAVVVNSTSSTAQFNLQRLMEGRTYRELEQEIQARQQAISAGSVLTPAVPSMSIHVTGSGFVEAGQRGRIEGTLSSGEYGLVCRRDSPTGTIEAIYVKGPFHVD